MWPFNKKLALTQLLVDPAWLRPRLAASDRAQVVEVAAEYRRLCANIIESWETGRKPSCVWRQVLSAIDRKLNI